jgi:hypothetical protein
MKISHTWTAAVVVLAAAIAAALVAQPRAAARDLAPAIEQAPAAVTWVKVTGTGESWVRFDAVDIVRLSETDSNRAEMFTVAAGRLKSAGIVKDDALAQLRPAISQWVKVNNDGLLVNPRRITSVSFDETVSFTGKRATVYVKDLFRAGIAQEAAEVAKLEAMVAK